MSTTHTETAVPMYTSYFAGAAKAAKEAAGQGITLVPVAISRGVPKGFKGLRYLPLAPTWGMLKMTQAGYDSEFAKILAGLNPLGTFDGLVNLVAACDRVPATLLDDGDAPVPLLLCFEKPGDFCHRRVVAEWFEDKLGVEVPEWGVDMATYPKAADLVKA